MTTPNPTNMEDTTWEEKLLAIIDGICEPNIEDTQNHPDCVYRLSCTDLSDLTEEIKDLIRKELKEAHNDGYAAGEANSKCLVEEAEENVREQMHQEYESELMAREERGERRGREEAIEKAIKYIRTGNVSGSFSEGCNCKMCDDYEKKVRKALTPHKGEE